MWPVGVSLHASLVEYLATITAYWYVPEELAGRTAMLTDFGDRRGHRHHGLFGGLLIEPKGWATGVSTAGPNG